MLLNTRNEETQQTKGFSPFVQNKEIYATCGMGGKIGFWILLIISIGLFGIYWITQKNYFNRKQNAINEAASGIDIQLAKRKDTLVKLYDATSSFMKFEKDYISDVTKLRNINVNASNRAEVSDLTSSALSRLMMVNERYPDVKSSRQVQELMQTAEYLEREIAASRSIYNSHVNEFNQELFTWPGSYIATSMKLCTFALFAASAQQKEDVSFKDLNK